MASAFIELAKSSLPPKIQRFINTHIRKGENLELKTELNSDSKERRKDAVKRVIANMTVGKDVSGLFTDVMKCMQTDDIELKKLVYLYLMNYSKSQPELVILAVNSFVKDSEDHNPLIRALAVRTMGCLRVEKIVDYLLEPLAKALRDPDPYVRKTAAICVAKMYELRPITTVDAGFVAILHDLLADSNPMVVANSVAALAEIKEHALDIHIPDAGLKFDNHLLHKLLVALNDCTEWGQIFILDSLATYTPTSPDEALTIIEKISPRLSHNNAALVLSCIRVLIIFLPKLNNPSVASTLVRKLSPPLISLLSISYELTYVALRNINLILQHLPTLFEQLTSLGVNIDPCILTNDIRLFFCKYDDPQFVKIEKLDILLSLCNQINHLDVVQELFEYANDVDVSFSRKAIRCIGGCALKIESSRDRCIQILTSLLSCEVSHVVCESILALSFIIRRYPNLDHSFLFPVLCPLLDSTLEEEPRIALVWIVGYFANYISDAESQLEPLVDAFNDESLAVQMQILSSCLFCDIHRRNSGIINGPSSEILKKCLSIGLNSSLPDLRDRAVLFFRMLSLNDSMNVLNTVFDFDSSPINPFVCGQPLAKQIVSDLIPLLGSLSSLRHELPSIDVFPGRETRSESPEDDEDDIQQRANITPSVSSSPGTVQGAKPTALLDLDDIVQDTRAVALALSHDSGGQGLDIFAHIDGNLDSPSLSLKIRNVSGPSVASDFAIQFNKNSLGLVPAYGLADFMKSLVPGSLAISVSLPLTVNKSMIDRSCGDCVQIAIKSTLGIVYFSTKIPPTWINYGHHNISVEDLLG